MRRVILQQRYGFTCACARCEAAFPGQCAGVPATPGVSVKPPPTVVEDAVIFRCTSCEGGRVFMGAAACADCGAPVPVSSVPGVGGSPATPGPASAPMADWDRARRAWLARESSKSLKEVVMGE